jgi:hypothetical protein
VLPVAGCNTRLFPLPEPAHTRPSDQATAKTHERLSAGLSSTWPPAPASRPRPPWPSLAQGSRCLARDGRAEARRRTKLAGLATQVVSDSTALTVAASFNLPNTP